MTARSILLAAALGSTLMSTGRLSAQTTDAPPRGRWEFTVPTGIVLPTGAQRDAIDRGKMTAAQLSYVVNPAFAVNATIGWTRSRDVASVGDPKLDVFTYDIGGELRAHNWITHRAVTLSPFAGAGAGGRSYNYRSLDVDATHNAAAYASVGGEVGYRRVRLRLEARDYVTAFRPLNGGGSTSSRNDVALMMGLRIAAR